MRKNVCTKSRSLNRHVAVRQPGVQRRAQISPVLCRLLGGSSCLFVLIGVSGLLVRWNPGVRESLGLVRSPALSGSAALVAGALVFAAIYLCQSMVLTKGKLGQETLKKRRICWRSI